MLFVLWEPVYKVALGGVKYGLKVLNNMKIIKLIRITTQDLKVENGRVIVIGRKSHSYAKRSSRRFFFYELLLILTIVRSIDIIKRENIHIIISPGVGWINDAKRIVRAVIRLVRGSTVSEGGAS